MNPEQEPMRNWASKLEQLPTPDPAGSWTDMRLILDREMPLTKGQGTRRWVIMTLLLLLVLGVCNCPGLVQVDSVNQMTKPALSKTESVARSKSMPLLKKKNHQDRTSTLPEPAQGSPNPNRPQILESNSGNSQRKEKILRKPVITAPSAGLAKENPRVKPSKQKHKSRFFVDSLPQEGQPNPVGHTAPEPQAKKDDLIQQNKLQKTQAKVLPPPRKDSLEKLVSKTKSAHRPSGDTSAKSPLNPRIQEDYGKGWELGLGLNQFFPVGHQQSSNFNSSGLTGSLTDYIPVPVIRYYFDRRSYVQAEAEINCPQFTKNLLASQVGTNSSGNSTDQNSTYIQKLFYFNLPVSIYYSPIRHLYVGSGLQFSALTNGVALFQDKEISVGSPDSVKFSKHQSLKSTPVYKELTTTEWRFLFDLNYHWKPITIGVRYNQALSKFINVRISNTEVTQARNSSLQIYLRYVLWKNRKKIIIPPK